MIKQCQICFEQFNAIQKTEKYCCTKCSYTAIKNKKNKIMEKTTESKMTIEEMAAQRELDAKPFSEVSDTEKINRLVRTIREMEWGTRNLIGRIGNLEQALYLMKYHSHNETGVVIAMDKTQVSNTPSGLSGVAMADSSRRNLLV